MAELPQVKAERYKDRMAPGINRFGATKTEPSKH